MAPTFSYRSKKQHGMREGENVRISIQAFQLCCVVFVGILTNLAIANVNN